MDLVRYAFQNLDYSLLLESRRFDAPYQVLLVAVESKVTEYVALLDLWDLNSPASAFEAL